MTIHPSKDCSVRHFLQKLLEFVMCVCLGETCAYENLSLTWMMGCCGWASDVIWFPLWIKLCSDSIPKLTFSKLHRALSQCAALHFTFFRRRFLKKHFDYCLIPMILLHSKSWNRTMRKQLIDEIIGFKAWDDVMGQVTFIINGWFCKMPCPHIPRSLLHRNCLFKKCL